MLDAASSPLRRRTGTTLACFRRSDRADRRRAEGHRLAARTATHVSRERPAVRRWTVAPAPEVVRTTPRGPPVLLLRRAAPPRGAGLSLSGPPPAATGSRAMRRRTVGSATWAYWTSIPATHKHYQIEDHDRREAGGATSDGFHLHFTPILGVYWPAQVRAVGRQASVRLVATDVAHSSERSFRSGPMATCSSPSIAYQLVQVIRTRSLSRPRPANLDKVAQHCDASTFRRSTH